jgi:hypothetical protein
VAVFAPSATTKALSFARDVVTGGTAGAGGSGGAKGTDGETGLKESSGQKPGNR